MNKFYEISTKVYAPLSHDNKYLFYQYEKVHNLIRQHIGPEYKNIIAKPIKHELTIEWFSPLKNLKKLSDNNDFAINRYWEFKKKLDNYLESLSTSDENSSPWIPLLNKIFKTEDNIIFYNENDITVIWGWEFENNSIPGPNLVRSSGIEIEEPQQEEIVETTENIEEENEEPEIGNEPEDENEPGKVPLEVEEIMSTEVIEETPNLPVEENTSFLEFLKYFASKYWWLLIILLCLIVIVYLTKTLFYGGL